MTKNQLASSLFIFKLSRIILKISFLFSHYSLFQFCVKVVHCYFGLVLDKKNKIKKCLRFRFKSLCNTHTHDKIKIEVIKYGENEYVFVYISSNDFKVS